MNNNINYWAIFRGIALLLFLNLWFTTDSFATHNRAGDISIAQVGDCTQSLTVRAIVTTYTKASSRPADRDTLTICWGDGVCERVARSNGPGDPPKGIILENDTKKNLYVAFHTYPARGTYVVSMTDPNRNGGILNVNFPNSEQVKFHIQTTYTFPNPQFQGCNNTPILLQPPIDIGCVGKVFTHNPNAYDEDGDSLSYHFITPLMDVGQVVPNYLFPDMISPGPDNKLTINEVTGDIIWNAPQKAGEYNLAFIIVEYREGFPIDTIVRDLQILIQNCANDPPNVVTPIEEICVVAGDILEFQVRADAPIYEQRQKVRLTALGGPFEVAYSPAQFLPTESTFRDDPVIKTFRWVTSCEHISDQYWSVVFKATDNFYGDSSGLATLKTIRIKVTGPPPEDLVADPGSQKVDLSWALPYVCDEAADNYFRGFTVWRREGSNQFETDICTPGLTNRGYEKLTPVAFKDVVDGRYFFSDPDVERGRTYCYRVLGEFAKTTPGGLYTYNRVESLPSMEVCVQLNRDVPLIVKTDVIQTATADGSIDVCWLKPQVADLDTLQNPGPYTYEVLRAQGMRTDPADFSPIGISYTSEFFATANDTCFTDTGLNTQDEPYSYIINFYVAGEAIPLGSTNHASSIYLNITPTDRQNVLSWEESVPWDNYEYEIWRQNDQGNFERIGITNTRTFIDEGLDNGTEYCYKILAVGSYGIQGIQSRLLNNSQVACAFPIDNVPPCVPTLEVTNDCENMLACDENNPPVNTLNWTNPLTDCDHSQDLAGFRVYYSPVADGSFEWIADITNPNTTTMTHSSEFGLAGCYAVTSVDQNGNESAYSNIICVDNCPTYRLPNAFTPNGDGQNDLFKPYPYCFVDRIDLKIFNRWGQLVFETQNPDILWDGKDLSGTVLTEGTYYYTCTVFGRYLEGEVALEEPLSGWIEIIIGN